MIELLSGGSMKTLHGIETYASFSNAVITIDLLRLEYGIPYPLAFRHCNYDQLARNVEVIHRGVI